jgi:hypothetical protein
MDELLNNELLNDELLNDELLNKAIKYYNNGKKLYDINDKTKARKMFENSLNAITEFKKLKQENLNQEAFSNINSIINNTEADCMKHLNDFNIFDIVTKNNIDVIKQMEHINFREINGNGNTVLHHTIDVGDIGILKEMFKKGGMIDTVNGNGNTLLEYACLKKDPNIIAFMVSHGANMQKHLFFRKGNHKFYLNKSDIDMAIILKLIIINRLKIKEDKLDKSMYASFVFLEKHFNLTELIGFDKYTIRDMLIGLHQMFNNKESYKSYSQIINEDLIEYENNKINKCIYTKIDIVLSNIVPFINYPYNIASIFIVKNEIKYLMKNILRYNKKDFKNILMIKLFENYIQTGLFPEDYIGIIIYNILSKIDL